MSIRASGFYNNPAFAQAASNLAGLFAPPSGADAAGWATAQAKRDEAARLQWLFDNFGDPSASQRSALTGVQSYGATPEGFRYDVDQRTGAQKYGYDRTYQASTENNIRDNQRLLTDREMQEAAAMERLGVTDATARYKIGMDAGVSTGNNLRDNQTKAITDLFAPVDPGQVRPQVPEDFMSVLQLPGVEAVTGLPKPLTESEVKGSIIQGLSPELQQAIGFGNTPVEQIVTPEGPRIETRLGAIGQEPVINKGAEASAKLLNYQTPDGRTGSALFDPTTQTLVDASSRQPLPEGTRTYTGQLSGGQDETGFGLTGATASSVQKQIISLDQTLDTAKTLRNLVASSPSSQGLVGSLRGTAQDIIATGGDLGQFFGGAIEEANQAVRDGMLDAGIAAENFDPNIPAIQMMTNLLAWQYAKSLSGDRVSNEQLAQARAAIGGEGLFANRANTLTRLDQLIESWGRQRNNLQPLAPGVGVGDRSGAPAPTGGTRLRFDENGNQL